MKSILKLVYMFFLHPVLFWKYSIKSKSRCFFVNGLSQSIKLGKMQLGRNIRLGNQSRIGFYSNKGKSLGKLQIGDNCYFGNRNTFLVGADIVIGKNVLMASDICISSENHKFDPLDETEYMHQPLDMKEINIGNGCWIGEKVVILPGVSIGKKCVIGAGSIVTKSIPSYSVAVGNPCKVKKKYNFNNMQWENI